ncbi:MAG: DUF6382 domain-containing protein [Huintestinicola sp.]
MKFDYTKKISINSTEILVPVDEETEDKIGCSVIINDNPDFLCRFSVLSVNDKRYFRYTVGNLTDLKTFCQSIKLSDFINVIKKIVLAMHGCDDYLLDYHNLVMDSNMIYISPDDMSIRFLFIPEKSSLCDDDDIRKFFIDLVKCSEISDNHKVGDDFLEYAISKDFSVTDFLMIIRRTELALRDMSKRTSPSAENDEKSALSAPKKRGFMIGKKSGVLKSADEETDENTEEKSEADLIFDEIFSDVRRKNAFVSPIQTDIQNIAAVQVNTEQNDYLYKDVQEYNERAFFRLIDPERKINAPSRIYMLKNKNELTIGRRSRNGEPVCEFEFPADMNKISRKHAKLFIKDRDYFLMDLDSLNHTFIDGRKLEANSAEKLVNGSKVVFGDSLYTYEFLCD